MSDNPETSLEGRIKHLFETNDRTPDRAMKNFRYVVSSVNDSAIEVWAELWKEFHPGVTPDGLITPALDQGFEPSCGWPEFLEKFCLLKHYLDYVHRFCQ